jgi:hypothetical protein
MAGSRSQKQKSALCISLCFYSPVCLFYNMCFHGLIYLFVVPSTASAPLLFLSFFNYLCYNRCYYIADKYVGVSLLFLFLPFLSLAIYTDVNSSCISSFILW